MKIYNKGSNGKLIFDLSSFSFLSSFWGTD